MKHLPSCSRCHGPSRRRAVKVITSVWDIPRLCSCDWLDPDFGSAVRTYRRVPDPSCPYHIRSALSRALATPVGVAA